MPKDATKKSMMSSVDRALGLLQHFSLEQPEIGLSDLARAAGVDKATTLRSLKALENNGFVEQHSESRKYRLGIAPLHLARIREGSFPLQALVQPILDALVDDIAETAHANLLRDKQLVTIAISQPARATRVFVDPSEVLPLHATASGLAVLGTMSRSERDALNLGEQLEAFTPDTPRSLVALEDQLAAAKMRGTSRAFGSFEEDVVGTAVPIFGWSDAPVGTIAIAAVASRFDDTLGKRIDTALLRAAQTLSQQLGG